ncbi:MAG TPA: DNA-processing protein DprA [Candidatus Angelobacter sp.]|nr:DNA-processing protein DprA [Candidatus Angelobacter sp.]
MNGIGRGGPLGPVAVSQAGRATERQYWIAISLVPGIGPVTFWQLIGRFGSATGAWRAGPAALDQLRRVSTDAARGWERLSRSDPGTLADAITRATAAVGGRVVTALDEEYPPALRIRDPRPPTLYVVGDGAAFAVRAVAVVGTRRASGYGLSAATDVATDLAEAGVAVVSGLALGIDGAAHRAAVEAAGRTIAVLPTPIDRIYPPRHRGLAARIVRAGGALVSELPTGATVGRPDFARRNRLIAGLTEAVVVVEAPDRSGALLTAAAAIQLRLEVYAVPGPISAMASRGCNRLIADKLATLVTSSADLLRQIGLSRGTEPPVTRALSEVEGQLLHRLLERPGSLEELVDRTRQHPASVASALNMLEARGLVSSFGGATFHPSLAARRLAKVV